MGQRSHLLHLYSVHRFHENFACVFSLVSMYFLSPGGFLTLWGLKATVLECLNVVSCRAMHDGFIHHYKNSFDYQLCARYYTNCWRHKKKTVTSSLLSYRILSIGSWWIVIMWLCTCIHGTECLGLNWEGHWNLPTEIIVHLRDEK